MKLSHILLITTPMVLFVGCGVVTAFLESVGVPVTSEATEQAAKVDQQILTWVDKMLWSLLGIGASEGTRATTRVVKKRRAKTLATKEGG